MARRRREDPPPQTNPGAAPEPTIPGVEPRIDVRMTGGAAAVKRQLGVQTEEKPVEKPEDNGHDDEKRKFVEALRNPKYVIRVKRQTPREFNGQKTNVEVWQAELPLDYQEIQTEVAKGFGGEKYRVAVIDPQSNTTVAADTFSIEGDPVVPETDATQEEMDRILMRGKPLSAAELTEEGLERRARLTAKQIEVEAYEEQLEAARKRRDAGGKPATQDNSRVEELDRKLTEAKHQAELESRDRKHAEELRQLRELIEKNARPAKQEGASETTLILAQMQKSQEAADKRFEALQKQMQDDKLNALLEEVKSLKNKPQQNNMLEMAETMLKLNKMINGVRGVEDDDEDEEDDKNDDRPWWERAIDKLGGKFGDKFLDKLLEKFGSMEEKGEQVTREQFIKDMSDEAQRMADAAVARANRQNLPAPAVNPPLPAPPPPPRPEVTVPQPQVTALPPPPPPAAEAPAAVPAPAPEGPLKITLEQEIVIRVAGVLEILEREIELRPNEYRWNYEGAFCALPESILEKVCAAPDPVAMIDAFAIPLVNPDNLAEMKKKIEGNPRIFAWLKSGHDDLKEWWAEKQKDPTFDPFADEEVEGE